MEPKVTLQQKKHKDQVVTVPESRANYLLETKGHIWQKKPKPSRPKTDS